MRVQAAAYVGPQLAAALLASIGQPSSELPSVAMLLPNNTLFKCARRGCDACADPRAVQRLPAPTHHVGHFVQDGDVLNTRSLPSTVCAQDYIPTVRKNIREPPVGAYIDPAFRLLQT